MAIYHFHAKVITRGRGQNTLASASYRSGELLKDESINKSWHYKREVQPESFILTPPHAPEEFKDRQKLWNAVEQSETRSNAQLAREFVVALPNELPNSAQRELVEKYVQEQFVNIGMVADVAIHRDDKNNPHAHVMLTLRALKEDGTWAGKKKREYIFDENKNHVLDKKGQKKFKTVPLTDWNSKARLLKWREEWSVYTNEKLKEYNINKSIDHRSFKDQGLEEKLPTLKMWKEDNVLEKKERNRCQKEGIEYKPVTERGQINALIRKHNETLEQLNNVQKQKVILMEAYNNPVVQKNVTVDPNYYRFFNDKERLASAYVSQKISDYNNETTLPFEKELNPVTLEQSMRGIVAWGHKLEKTRQDLELSQDQNAINYEDIEKFDKQYEFYASVKNAYETVQQAFERNAPKKLAVDYQNGALEKLPTAQVNQILNYNHTHLEKLPQNEISNFLKQQKDILDFKEYADMKTVSLHRAVYYNESLDYKEIKLSKDMNEFNKLKQQDTSSMNMEQNYYQIKATARQYEKVESNTKQLNLEKELSSKAIKSLYNLEKEHLLDRGIDTRLLDNISAHEYVRISKDFRNLDDKVLKDVKEEAFKQQAYEFVNRRIFNKEMPEVKFLESKENNNTVAIDKLEELKDKIERWGASIEKKALLSPEISYEKEKKMFNEQLKKVSYVYEKELNKEASKVEHIDKEFTLDNKSTLKEVHSAQQDKKPSEYVKNTRTSNYIKELEEEVPRKPITKYEDLYRVEAKLQEDRRYVDYRKEHINEKEEKLESAKQLYDRIISKEKNGENSIKDRMQLQSLGYTKDNFNELSTHKSQQLKEEKKQVEYIENKVTDKEEKLKSTFIVYAEKTEQEYAKAYSPSSKEDLSTKEKAFIVSENQSTAANGKISLNKAPQVISKHETQLNASISLDKTERMSEYYDKKIKKEEEKLEGAKVKLDNANTGVQKVKAQQEVSKHSQNITELKNRDTWSHRNEVKKFTEGKWANGLSKEQSIQLLQHVEKTGQRLPNDENSLDMLKNVVQSLDNALEEAKRQSQGASKQYNSEADYFYEKENRIGRQTSQGRSRSY
ncbi:hypothetical protein GFV16_00115 [Bacillus megaterium]|uniref:MobQ family relaxase n=1 Tax=Priestia megaterium TaxID=1404 RepID=UPI001293C0FA|nr:MobQ family relaxase [Priestia megaterium]MQR84348.1 hypothetical protein [Priestia megaterium]